MKERNKTIVSWGKRYWKMAGTDGVERWMIDERSSLESTF